MDDTMIASGRHDHDSGWIIWELSSNVEVPGKLKLRLVKHEIGCSHATCKPETWKWGAYFSEDEDKLELQKLGTEEWMELIEGRDPKHLPYVPPQCPYDTLTMKVLNG